MEGRTDTVRPSGMSGSGGAGKPGTEPGPAGGPPAAPLAVGAAWERRRPEAQREEKAASKAAAGGSIAARLRTKDSASGAPMSRSIPASSHSIEIGPS